MRTLLITAAAFCFVGVSLARADSMTASVQQKLKDQGFYYGEISGTKDADTTAAIRRYQIRNGLKITGELNAETQKSLGVHGSAAANANPAPTARPENAAPPARPSNPAPDVSDLRENDRAVPQPPTVQQQQPNFATGAPQPGYAPGPHGLSPATSGVFNGTPFEVAPPDVQRRVVVGAQTLLARQGYYRGFVDGEFGVGTSSALRAYQSRFRIAPSGRLDMQTLAALGLLPGQSAPGIDVPRRRIYRPTTVPPGAGERVYIPR
jgi:peptidoglycan hydrolase-like protein with peptidoglycan-binding domain